MYAQTMQIKIVYNVSITSLLFVAITWSDSYTKQRWLCDWKHSGRCRWMAQRPKCRLVRSDFRQRRFEVSTSLPPISLELSRSDDRRKNGIKKTRHGRIKNDVSPTPLVKRRKRTVRRKNAHNVRIPKTNRLIPNSKVIFITRFGNSACTIESIAIVLRLTWYKSYVNCWFLDNNFIHGRSEANGTDTRSRYRDMVSYTLTITVQRSIITTIIYYRVIVVVVVQRWWWYCVHTLVGHSNRKIID